MKMSKVLSSAKFMVLSLMALFVAVVACFCAVFFNSNPTKAESIDSDLEVTVNSVLELSLSTCNSADSSQVVVSITPSSAGTFKSNCQVASVHTNAPGYTLTAKASSSTLNYLNPTTISPTPTIASTVNTIASPNAIENNTWGFAVEGNGNFDSTYSIDNAANTYASLPTTDTTIYSTTTFPLPETNHTFYYGARLTPSTVAGTYATTITYTAIGAEVPPIPEISCVSGAYYKGRVGTMQNASTTTASWQIGDNGIATDTRNNQDYCIRKMEDNKVWMITNLKLDGTTVKATRADGTATLTPQDTNIAQNFTIPDAGLSTTNVYNSPMIDKDVATPGAKSDQTDINAEDFYGYYYNWCAAKAGTSESCTANGTYPTASSYDICPVGWRLPTGSSSTTNNDFALLNGMMAGDNGASTSTNATHAANWSFSGPFRGVLSGRRYSSSWSSQGSYGYFWSGSFFSSYANSAHYLLFNSSYVYPTNSSSRYDRFAARCLLQP